MCPPAIMHRLDVDHDDRGLWTVAYSEDDYASQVSSSVDESAFSLPAALRRLADRLDREEIMPNPRGK